MHIDTGDTAFMLVCSAFVMLMTPGLAMFYGGMVRVKNVLATLMQNFSMLAVMSVLWAIIGYSLAFGHDIGGLIGGLDFAFLRGVTTQANPEFSATIPHSVFMIFQAMFAIITPALFTGAIAERTKFSGLMLFSVLWAILVYAPVCHWVWGPGGWLKSLGVLDFAGGIVVHANAAAAALAMVIVIGPRIGYKSEPMPPHNLPMTLLGAGLLWFGWFGFNAGSALGANGAAATAFITTHLSAAAATLSWCAAEWIILKRPTTLGAASGCIAGLATITPAAGFVSPMAAIAIGIIAGLICFWAVAIKARKDFDDSLDVVGIHGVGGVAGSLMVGVFASMAINSGGANGLLHGGVALLGAQALGCAAVLVYSFVVSYALLKLVEKVVGLRVQSSSEIFGTDTGEHAERGYVWY